MHRIHRAVVGPEEVAIRLFMTGVCMIQTVVVALSDPVGNVRTLGNGVILDHVVGATQLCTVDTADSVVDVICIGESLVIPGGAGTGGEFAFGTVSGGVALAARSSCGSRSVASSTTVGVGTSVVSGSTTIGGARFERRRRRRCGRSPLWVRWTTLQQRLLHQGFRLPSFETMDRIRQW